MMLSLTFAALSAAGLAALVRLSAREHRAALAARAGLLDSLAGLFPDAGRAIAADGFPVVTGHLPDRRQVRVELIPDTLVMRRLPQLWLVVTIRERVERGRASIGALARPTGAEFYSAVHDLPERLETPPGLDPEILVRGKGRLPDAAARETARILADIFSDPRVKEVATTPRGVRIVRQAAEGERGAHLLLRQIRFPLAQIPPDLVRRSVAQADALRAALDRSADDAEKRSA